MSKDNLELEEIKQVEITKLRLTSKRSNFYTIPMKNIVSCSDLKDTKVPGKSHIRIIAVEEDDSNSQMIREELDQASVYKHLDFECDLDIVEEIKTSFSHLIMFCNSPHLVEYQKNIRKIVTTKWSRRLYQQRVSKRFTLY